MKPGEKKEIKTLELFGGAGGCYLGAKRAGLDTQWIVEKDQRAVATLRSNMEKGNGGHDPVYHKCVARFIQRSKERRSGYPRQGEVDHIHASPPCQGFSAANRNSGGPKDTENNNLSFAFVDAIRYYQPLTATYENVMGLVNRDENKTFLNRMIEEIHGMGYQIRLTVLDASDYGDPQVREQVVLFVANTSVPLPARPKPTHGDEKGLKKKQTAGNALRRFENIEPRICADKGHVHVGDVGRIQDHCVTESIPDEDDSNTETLDKDQPARTIRGGNRVMHYKHNRFLSIRENACLQSFPISYIFCGSEQQKLKQIGNAVPVKMATSIARSVGEAYGMEYSWSRVENVEVA